jgi:hypothetical protein
MVGLLGKSREFWQEQIQDNFARKHIFLLVLLSVVVAGLALLGFISDMQLSSEPVAQINITENSVSPSRPAISSEETVKFSNIGESQVYINFERGPESFSLPPDTSEIKTPEITTYYTVEASGKTFRGSIVVEEN